jgi:UDP-N-acetylglucosamine acyltransferase
MVIYKQSKTVEEAIAELETMQESEPSISLLVDFLRNSGRGICR